MLEPVLAALEAFVDAIYTVEQEHYLECYLTLLDTLEQAVAKLYDMGYQVDFTEKLTVIQTMHDKKDYTALADFCLYSFCPALIQLEKVISIS